VPLERDVQKAAVAVLEALGCVVHRRNTGVMEASYRGKRRFVRFSEPGSADLWAITGAGIHLEIEVKRPGERPTEAQVAWLLAHNGIGRAAAFWVDNAGTLERVVRHIQAGGRVQFVGSRGDYDLAGPRPSNEPAPGDIGPMANLARGPPHRTGTPGNIA
jgi:hypothetical protein